MSGLDPEAVGTAGLDRVSKMALAVLWEGMIAARERTEGDGDLLLPPYVAARRHPKTRRLVVLAEGLCAPNGCSP